MINWSVFISYDSWEPPTINLISLIMRVLKDLTDVLWMTVDKVLLTEAVQDTLVLETHPWVKRCHQVWDEAGLCGVMAMATASTFNWQFLGTQQWMVGRIHTVNWLQVVGVTRVEWNQAPVSGKVIGRENTMREVMLEKLKSYEEQTLSLKVWRNYIPVVFSCGKKTIAKHF